MKIAVSTDSSCDLTKEQIVDNDIKVLPFTILLGENMYKDSEIDAQRIYRYVEENKVLPKTTGINVAEAEDHFKNILDSGYDFIIHVSFSSKLSCSCESCMTAAKSFENKVFVIDALSLSTGTGLLVLYAADLVKQGLDHRIIFDKVSRRVPYVQASFVLKTLDYLYKGGRCSSLARFGANLLRIRPQIIVGDGKMSTGHYYRGKDNGVLRKYCEDVLEEFNNPDYSIGFVTYSNFGTPEGEAMADICEEMLRIAGFKKIVRSSASGVISSHCGPGTIGILYINDGGNK